MFRTNFCDFLILFVFYCFSLWSALGVTVGAHRLWSHRSFEARLPLRILLMILNTASLQNDIYEWCRDHRVHHKFSDTDADPHNANRGFFFSHMGWLLVRKHPEVLSRGKTIKMDDIAADPVVRFQRAFYKPLTMLCTFYLPALIPYYCWNENFYVAFYISAFRYALSLVSFMFTLFMLFFTNSVLLFCFRFLAHNMDGQLCGPSLRLEAIRHQDKAARESFRTAGINGRRLPQLSSRLPLRLLGLGSVMDTGRKHLNTGHRSIRCLRSGVQPQEGHTENDQGTC